jgi:2'-5' RNA ligase
VERLFVAVWPPAEVMEELRRLERPQRPGLRWTTDDQWHVTLRFLGDLDWEADKALRPSLGAVAAVAGPVVAQAGPRPAALGRSVWILPVQGLDEVARRVCDATGDIGQPLPNRPFRGHLTLARGRRPTALDGLPARPLAAQWAVSDLTLVRSELGADGARYDVVGRWPLATDSE